MTYFRHKTYSLIEEEREKIESQKAINIEIIQNDNSQVIYAGTFDAKNKVNSERIYFTTDAFYRISKFEMVNDLKKNWVLKMYMDKVLDS